MSAVCGPSLVQACASRLARQAEVPNRLRGSLPSNALPNVLHCSHRKFAVSSSAAFQLNAGFDQLKSLSGTWASKAERTARRETTRCATTEDVDAETELIEQDAMERMEKTLESVQNNFNTVRTGRASPALLDRVEVEYYGTPVNIKSIAQVTTPDGSTILVSPFDKSSLGSIEKAILKSDLSLNPSNDGSVIRISIPQLTADRRKELQKTVSKLAEDGKVALRNVRRDAIKSYDKLEKDKKLSNDNLKDLTDNIQKLTDDYVKKVDTILKNKEKELSSV